jgi:hypothetical protein
MLLNDYPAAHSMDTDWFAVDGAGQVGLFQSGPDGAYPSDAYGGGSLHDGVSGPDLNDILHQLRAGQQDADPDDWEVDGFVQAGLYVFESSDGEHLSPPVEIHENFLAFPYTLTHRPDHPLHIGQLSPRLVALLRAVRLPASRFGTTPTVQPARQVSGSTWYSYSGVLLAYLDEDGITIRPIPGQEDHFADYCRDLLADFPEDMARLVLDPPLKNPQGE